MNNHPSDDLVSVIIPTFNRAAYLRITLPLICNQPHLGEVIIVDDSSTDDTQLAVMSVVQEFHNVKYHANDRHMGASASRNIGIDAAQYDSVLFLDDDVAVENDYVQLLLNHKKETGADIIGGRLIWMLPGENKEQALVRSTEQYGSLPPVDLKTLSVNCQHISTCDLSVPIVTALQLMSLKHAQMIQFDTGYRVNGWREETDFQIRALKLGLRIFYCPHALAFHLPPQIAVDQGGHRSGGRIKYELWRIINDYRFYSMHSVFLQGIMKKGSPIHPFHATLSNLYQRLRRQLLTFGR